MEKERLRQEVSTLRARIAELEARDTDGRRAEEALRESEEKFRLVMENAGEAITINQDGMYKFLNRRALELMGYSREELSAMPFVEFVHPDDQELVRKRYARRMKGETVPNVYSIRIVDKGGATKWIEIHVVLISWEGRPATLNFFVDVTARKQTEDELRASEIRYQTIFENTGTVMLIVEEDMTISLVNDRFESLTGYKRQDVEGKMKWTDFVVKEDLEKMISRHRLRRVDPGSAKNSYEFRLVHKDGYRKNILLTVDVIPGTGKSVASLIDITRRKEAEEALQTSEARMRAVFDSVQDFIFIKNRDRRYITINRFFEKRFQVDPAVFIGHNDAEIPIFENKAETAAITQGMDARVLRGETAHYELTHVICGTRVTFDIVKTPIRDPQGNVVGICGLSRDITERRRIEKENQKLEERLQHADKMDAIGTLAGGIAHDFNNLLMGIQGYTSLTLLDMEPSHPHYEKLKRIEEQVRSGTDLTRQLLGFAHAGRYEVKPSDVSEIVERTSSMFGRTRKELSIYKNLRAGTWTVDVDRGQMEQVFLNLYVNAWQAMPAGGAIHLETRNVILDEAQVAPYSLTPGKYVSIVVTDTGMGMDVKTRERIFEPFFTTKTMGRGTGLGLAMVYGIVKGHGGMIQVDSEPGRGTTFTIFLPASESEKATEVSDRKIVARGSGTILLVDDEPLVAEVTGELLQSLGYEVYVAGSGQEAIDLFVEKEKLIDLVILDMIMPGLSGSETFNRLRDIHPGIKVLLSSGYSINGEAQNILERGCNGFLQKPFRLEELSGRIRELLEAEGSRPGDLTCPLQAV
jgi:PAS domain S-box-containing protein